jgi:hypothetical protein
VLGGVFIVNTGDVTAFEVLIGADFEAIAAEFNDRTSLPAIPSRLNPGWPLIPGLPTEFASAVQRGLDFGPCSIGLPAGILRIDRAGFDERESGSPVFEMAARLLRCVLAVRLQDKDVELEARTLMSAW